MLIPKRSITEAPRTTIVETIIRKFDSNNRAFLVANLHTVAGAYGGPDSTRGAEAVVVSKSIASSAAGAIAAVLAETSSHVAGAAPGAIRDAQGEAGQSEAVESEAGPVDDLALQPLVICYIIYCSEGFCRLTGFSRGEVVQRPAVCDFLHGPLTSQRAVTTLREAIFLNDQRHIEILYYRKDGTVFECSEVIAPVRSESDGIQLCILNFEDLSADLGPDAKNSAVGRFSRFNEARKSFNQSIRQRGLRFLAPASTITEVVEEEDEVQQDRLIPTRVQLVDEKKREPFEQKASSMPPELGASECRPGPSKIKAPIASPESIPSSWEVSAAAGRDETHSVESVRKQAKKNVIKSPASRSATLSNLREPDSQDQPPTLSRPHSIANFGEATLSQFSSKLYPQYSSETELRRRSSSQLWQAPSLSNLTSDGVRTKFSDNGSTKFFQEALHTPNMGERVAQVSHP